MNFSNLMFLGNECCTSERVGQDHIVTCTELGIEMIWSPTEQGSLDAAITEHSDAHRKAYENQCNQRDHAAAVESARWIYRNTEPNSPLRRGINAYAAYL